MRGLINRGVLVSVIINTDGSRRMFQAFLFCSDLRYTTFNIFATGSVYFVVYQVKAFAIY